MQLTSQELTKHIVRILDSKKAEDITAIKVRDLTIVADYFIIASGTSTTQVKALADEVEFQMGKQDIHPQRTEGYPSGEWVVLDYQDVIVHVFYRATREFYSLERLWADGEQVNIEDMLK